MSLEIVDWGPEKEWKLDMLVDILTKVKKYAEEKRYRDVIVTLIENQTYTDPKNNRHNVEIVYTTSDGKKIRQLLLYLKGEIVDCDEFHRRFNEFYD